jgi:N-acyl homoserine lactone hydrolase
MDLDAIDMRRSRYELSELISGYPGRSATYGGLGWCSISVLRNSERVILVDTGSFGMRPVLKARLNEIGIEPVDVTDILITHVHYDHCANFTLFPKATIWINAEELDWAVQLPPGFDPVPELCVDALSRHERVISFLPTPVILPGITALAAPGHTPGSTVYSAQLTSGTTAVFTGDAIKNRAEFISGEFASTMDELRSKASWRKINSLCTATPSTIIIPGHDLTLIPGNPPRYKESRTAVLSAWLGTKLADITDFDITRTEDQI